MFKKPKFVFVSIVILIVVFLSLPLPLSQKVKIKIADFFSPVLKFSQSVSARLISFKEIFKSADENKILRKKCAYLAGRLAEFEEMKEENRRLKKLLYFKENQQGDAIVCRVIARDAGSWYKTLIIDKGADDGIGVGFPVVSDGAAVGRITDCDESTSRVLLISDINSSVGGLTQDTRAAGLVEGDGEGGCFFNLVSKKIDIALGSSVVTSGFGTVFPKGILIGAVTEVTEGEQGLFKKAKIELSADLDRIEEVMVLKKYDNQKASTNVK